MKTIHKILFFISLLALYFIVKELIQLIVYTSSINWYFGYLNGVLIIITLGYFVVLPLYKILRMPSRHSPVKGSSITTSVLKKRIDHLKGIVFLDRVESNFELITEIEYQKLVSGE